MTQLRSFAVKDPVTCRDDMCRTMRNGLIRRGVANPNVGPGSDSFLSFTALANELAVIGANGVVKADQMMPDTAENEDLERSAAVFDLSFQPAAGSVGEVIITSSATSPIPTDAELTDEAGLRYKVSVGGDYANGDPVLIEAIDVGDATNHAEGDVLRWANAPTYCSEQVLVGVGGLVNGIDTEVSEDLRARELTKLQTPPGAGNPQHFIEQTEKSTPRVQKAFCYPAALGPSTVRVATTAAPTKTNKGRQVASTVMSSIVTPYVVGSMPQHAHVGLTTVDDVEVDVAFALSLPEAPTANPPGNGGGWTNGTPWPTPNGSSTFRCTVTVVTNSTSFRVDAATPPTDNVTRIAWLSPVDWKLYTALVTFSSGTSGAYDITIDQPFPGVTVGCYVWPESQNAQLYVDSVLAQFAAMGPGEVTSNASALVRGFRHPRPSEAYPYALGPHLLNRITDDNDEALDAQFFHRTDNSQPALTGAGGQLVPEVPATADLAPRQFIPRHLAFYRVP
jgi:uncharacterized phage protein gp47/JayE